MLLSAYREECRSAIKSVRFSLSGKSTTNSSKALALKFLSTVMECLGYWFFLFSATRKIPILIALLNNNGSEKGSPNPFVSLPFATSIGLTVTTANKPVGLLSKISTDHTGFTYRHAYSPVLPVHRWSLILTTHRFRIGIVLDTCSCGYTRRNKLRRATFVRFSRPCA